MKRTLALLFTLSACAQTPKLTEVNLTYVKSPLNAPLIVGYQKGIFEEAFKKEGVQIKWHEINSGAQQTEAMAAGSVDISPVLGGTSALLAAANGADLKILGVFGRAPKVYLLMAKNPAIKTAADLKGKAVGGPKGSVLHQLLAAVMIKEGLSLSDVTLVSMGFPEALSAMGAGKLDAALLPANVKTAAEGLGARLIADGEGLIQGSTVTAVRGDFLKKHPALVKTFQQAHLASIQYTKDNPEETIALSAEALGLSIDEIKAQLPLYNFDPSISAQDRADFEATQSFLVEAGLLNQKADLDKVIVK